MVPIPQYRTYAATVTCVINENEPIVLPKSRIHTQLITSTCSLFSRMSNIQYVPFKSSRHCCRRLARLHQLFDRISNGALDCLLIAPVLILVSCS